jgi:hypothetical protein
MTETVKRSQISPNVSQGYEKWLEFQIKVRFQFLKILASIFAQIGRKSLSQMEWFVTVHICLFSATRNQDDSFGIEYFSRHI